MTITKKTPNLRRHKTQFTANWFDADGERRASVALELDSETFHARHRGYYLGHYKTLRQAVAAVEKRINQENRQ